MESACPSAKRTRLAALEATEASDAQPTANEPPPPAAGEAVDSISHLPDAVLGEIISLLPTKDGARTQTLASRWRYLWRAAPLNLDCCGLAADDEYVLLTATAILAAHQGTGRRFRFPARFLRNRAATVDAWLRSPALDNLEELEFYVPKYRDVSSPPPASPPTPISRFSSTLRIATISQCSLPNDTVETLHFPLLRKLALVQVKISEGSLHRIIAVGCPGLECLMLFGILSVRYLRINSPCIRSIGVRSHGHLELIIEDAPLLKRLLQLGTHMEMQISVISAPKLETLGCIPQRYVNSRVVFGSTIIQRLRIDNLTTVVRTVKILAVDMSTFNLDIVIDLMRCFPCLEKLYIKGCLSGETNLWRRKHRNFLRCSEIRLKTIVVGTYRGIQAQVNFVTFFILNARSLESMGLVVGCGDYTERFFAEQRSVLRMENRASRVARLYFMKDCWDRHSVSNIKHVNDLDLTDPFERGC